MEVHDGDEALALIEVEHPVQVRVDAARVVEKYLHRQV